MFKTALIHSADVFTRQMNHRSQRLKDMNLKQKIDMYQRTQMISGLMAPDSDTYKETRQILNNINAYDLGTSAAELYRQSRLSYLEFLKDPQKHFKQQLTKTGKGNTFDQFNANMGFSPKPEATQSEDVCSFIKVTDK